MEILVPSIPKKYVITQTMIEDLLYDPVKAAKVFFNIELDAFQRAALKIQWLSYDTEDHSGHGSSKTIRAWLLANLSCVLIPGCVVGVVYQNFQSGKDNFWKYFNEAKYMTPLFRSQLGRFDKGTHRTRAAAKEPGNWKLFFKSSGRIEMPAPGHLGNTEKLGSWEVNRMIIDEANKIRRMGEGIENQLLNRVRLPSFDPDHPVWQDKVWRMGTAETAEHPGFTFHQRRVKEEKTGNPGLFSFGFCYKDWSNMPAPGGKAFRDTVPNWRTIKSSNREMTKARRIAEGLGVYAQASEGWYNAQWFVLAENTGRLRNLEPALSRAMYRGTEFTRFFCGIDAARSARVGNDEGAIVVLMAEPKSDMPGDSEADWDLVYIYARVCLNHSAEKWSGVVHELHKAFGFTGILMDPGGSDFISCELKKERQIIGNIEQRCSPIVQKDDMEVSSGAAHFIISLTRSADPGVRKLWPDLAHARSGGGDTLKYIMNSAFQTAWEKGFLVLPPPYSEFVADKRADLWPKEKQDAARLLNPKTKNQILAVNALLDEKGNYDLTSNNAVQFVSSEKDDFHDAARNAYVAFRIWLVENEGNYQVRSKDAGMFWSNGGGGRGGRSMFSSGRKGIDGASD